VSPTNSTDGAFRVLIAGGGVAGVEAALALHELAADAVRVQLLSPVSDLVYRPMSVREPFAHGPPQRYPLAAIAEDTGAELVCGSLAWVDPGAREAHTQDDRTLPYDALLLALGARQHARYEHATTIDDRRMDELLHGLVQDVEAGYVERVAFIIPAPMAWPLPIYELALMTAGRAYDMSVSPAITVVTPEEAPLAIFGQTASAEVARLLGEAGIEAFTSAYAEIPEAGTVVLHPGDRRLQVDRAIALPELYGPPVHGLPLVEHGFLPVDRHGQVRGAERVFAAGDATDFAVKHGGIASQQADAAAEAIAALAGAAIEPQPFDPVIRGMLLTAERPRYLTAHITGGHGFSSEITDEPTWSPGAKIAARYLAPYLQQRDRAEQAASE
jgi:sulfide:quinone oxidoreductase